MKTRPWFRSVKLQTSTPTAVSPKSESDRPDALFDATIKEMKEAGDNTIVFTNFVDFDSSRGHRRDVAGYAAGLELFDRRLPELMSLLRDDDILISLLTTVVTRPRPVLTTRVNTFRYWFTARK